MVPGAGYVLTNVVRTPWLLLLLNGEERTSSWGDLLSNKSYLGIA